MNEMHKDFKSLVFIPEFHVWSECLKQGVKIKKFME